MCVSGKGHQCVCQVRVINVYKGSSMCVSGKGHQCVKGIKGHQC